MNQIQILRNTTNDNYIGILCPECKLNKITVSKYHLDDYHKDLKDSNDWGIKYNYEYLICNNCKSNFEDLKQMSDNEDKEIFDREYALELEYKENIRAVEPTKNKYCSIKTIRSHQYHNDHYHQYYGWINEEDKKSYVFKCGMKYPLKYWTLELVTNEHINKNRCGICTLLVNKNSKRKTGFTQYEVNELFRLGITNKSSSSKNFCSENNTVMHYSTIEKIRTENNTLIDNSQCWSAGFAHCEMNLGICSLPLTSLSRLDREFYTDIYSIKVLDTKKAILFTIRCEIKEYAKDDEYKTGEVVKRTKEIKYFLFGRDDGQDFLVELYDKPKTVKDAYKSMIPIEGKTKRKILRQGDLFFIPTEYKFKEYEKQHYIELEKHLPSDQEDHYNSFILDKIGNRFLKQKQDYYSANKFIIKDSTTRLIAQKAVIDYYARFVKAKKELVRNQIFDTNHESQFMRVEDNKTFVKGYIIHTNRQHQKLVLNKWYQVVKNRVKSSFTVERFGGMGRD